MSLRKWLYKYKYLHAEYIELDEVSQKYIVDFDSTFQSNPAKADENLKQELQESAEPDSISPTNKSKDLYKKLSKHTHPDVGGSSEEFLEVKNLYRSDDILGLISKAEEYNIDIESMELQYSEEDFERSCQELENKCNAIKTTLAWEWANADDSAREYLIEYYKTALGLNYIKK